jgi:5-methylcytosine-specific restriction enzyme A
MALADITREAVLAAVTEYDELGQDQFLDKYGFDRARRYVLVHDGKSYDSKPIAGAAHGHLPGQRPLTARQFSGGEATVGRLLRRLGFTVQVGDALTPDVLADRLAKLRVYRSGGPPALYQPITLLWALGRARRGEPRLAAWPQTRQEVSDLLTRYGRSGEGDAVHYPIAALHGAGLWDLDAQPESVPSAHGSSVPQRWFDEHQPNGGLVKPVYDLLRDSPEARAAAVRTLTCTYFTGADPTGLLAELGLTDPAGSSPAESALAALTEEQRQSLAQQYQRLCGRADAHWQNLGDKRATRTTSVPIRYEDARTAVMLRSQGRCENPRCSGDIQDLTDSGDPILEVDHLHDLAKGGADHPAQMIALCPNCHAVKTRGSTRDDLKQVLVEQARRRHDELSKS